MYKSKIINCKMCNINQLFAAKLCLNDLNKCLSMYKCYVFLYALNYLNLVIALVFQDQRQIIIAKFV